MLFITKFNNKKLILPTNDYVFKRIFGYKGNEDITKNLINSIINTKVTSINLDGNTILEKELLDDKLGILDIKATLNNDTLCNIEMQMINQNNIEKRIMYYWSKLFSSSISSGENYNLLKKTIVILIANFEINNIKEIPKVHTEWNIREKSYPRFILTNVFEIHIINLEKVKQFKRENRKNNFAFKDNAETTLNSWIKFLLTPDELEESTMENNEDIKKAKEELDNIRNDEYERRIAELRLKHIMDTKAIEEFGYDRGIEEGLKQGLEQGNIKATQEIAKKMLKENLNIDLIVKITGLTKEDIINIEQ